MVQVNVKKLPENLVGINSANIEPLNVRIWPNPNNGNFEISIEGEALGSVQTLKITNLLGQTVYEEELNCSSTSCIKSIDLKGIPAGTYFLNLESNQKSFKTKILISN